MDECNDGIWIGDAAVAGQEYDSDGYNVIVGFGNCGDASNFLPSSYAGPGPNGFLCEVER